MQVDKKTAIAKRERSVRKFLANDVQLTVSRIISARRMKNHAMMHDLHVFYLGSSQSALVVPLGYPYFPVLNGFEALDSPVKSRALTS